MSDIRWNDYIDRERSADEKANLHKFSECFDDQARSVIMTINDKR